MPGMPYQNTRVLSNQDKAKRLVNTYKTVTGVFVSMKKRYLQNIVFAFILALSMGSLNLYAQQNNSFSVQTHVASPSNTEVLSISKVRTMMAETESNMELSEDVRKKLLKQYRDSLYQIALSQQQKSETEDLKRYIEAAPEEIKKFQEQLLQLQKSDIKNQPLSADISGYATSKEVEVQLTKEQGILLELKNKLSGIEGEIINIQSRPEKIHHNIAEAKKKLLIFDER
jgi:hypothetical protein